MSVTYTMDRHLPDEAAMLQAERWAARLRSPECTSGERETFERWRSADPAHAKAYAAAEGLLKRVGALADDPAIAQAFAQALNTELTPASQLKRRSRWSVPLAFAAGLAVLSVAGLMVYRLAVSDTYSTGLGEQRSVTLPDGSKVVLDTSTSLHLAFDDGKRLVELERGQAQFDVAADPRRPFVVNAGGNMVTALGTVFDVRKERDVVTVTLVEGKVGIAQQSRIAAVDPTPREILSPGERLVFSRSGRESRRTAVDLEAARGWTRGNLIFKSTALAEAAAETNRYTEHRILVEPDVADIPISGVFRIGDTDGILIALEKSFPIRVMRESDGSVRLVRDPASPKT